MPQLRKCHSPNACPTKIAAMSTEFNRARAAGSIPKTEVVSEMCVIVKKRSRPTHAMTTTTM
jgi:hypothetical protein